MHFHAYAPISINGEDTVIGQEVNFEHIMSRAHNLASITRTFSISAVQAAILAQIKEK